MDKDKENRNNKAEAISSKTFDEEVTSFVRSKMEDGGSEDLTAWQGLSILRRLSGDHISFIATREGHVISYLVGLAYNNAVKLAQKYDTQRSSTP